MLADSLKRSCAAVFLSAAAVVVAGQSALAQEIQLAAAAKEAGDDCRKSGFQNYRRHAEQRLAECTSLLESGQLTDRQIAVARINRGIARTQIGDKAMADIDYLEAIKHYDSVIDPKAPHSLALYERGVALSAMGETDRALSDYNEAIRIDPKEPLAYFERGVALANRKREYGRAIADFTTALDLTPNNVEALIRRGDAYGQIGEFARALADLNLAVKSSPDYQVAYFFRGLAHFRRGESRLALTDYNTALAIHPRYIDALVARAGLYSLDGREDLALGDLDAALALERNNPVAFYNRGFVHFMKRDYERAIGDYSAAIGLDPEMGVAYNNRCLARTIIGQDLVGALSDCDMALKIMPSNLQMRETRGFIHLKLGDPAIAAVEFDAALKDDPNRTLALYGLGLARISLGQKKEGEADQAAARALNPSVGKEFALYGLK